MVFAVLASALHVLIFYMESIAWEGPLARKTFGGTPEEARAHAFYAFNQGFYNLFLALQAIIGVVLAALGHMAIGAALMLTGTGAMLAAAVVLAGLCTICDAERFHSHRRDGAGSGRQAVIAYLEEEGP